MHMPSQWPRQVVPSASLSMQVPMQVPWQLPEQVPWHDTATSAEPSQ